ncbi:MULTISPECIES: antibiotic biosynthesis monooxygenase [unclassified Methylibium]|uniref:antibiotic biosynthesis monooxygenase family protein n=1 Tax=unclassified Methylibium TaxID=2633235 RepID=UPI0006FC42C0|nr:antibiotic biosynthesis monooxygenase [Methylibium sp. Root1272]KQW68432.1 hypothetical protein ASC67_07040 [Methylibium sp. Root1272]
MSDAAFAALPAPPYYAVVFSSRRATTAPGTDDGYDAMAGYMVEVAATQSGFLGVESARDAEGFGITVSYWRSLEDIAAWKAHAEHRVARERGRQGWYAHYELRIARVERAYGGPSVQEISA